jgi:serine/threonine protein kinase
MEENVTQVKTSKKKVGNYYFRLGDVLGKGAFSKVYMAYMDPEEFKKAKRLR